jgi:hypothetical protein
VAGEAPVATTVSKVRSAASRWRTVVQRRSQRLSVARSGRLASAARRRRGACPSQSAATRRAPWNKASRPTVAVLDPRQRDLPHDIRRRYAGRKLAVDRFGNDKAQDMPEAVVEALAPMRCRISVTESRPHPDLAVTQLGGGQVGTSSAHRSKVQPLARSKRAWCQWQVRVPSSTLPRSSGKPI